MKESFTKWNGAAGNRVCLEFETGARPLEADDHGIGSSAIDRYDGAAAEIRNAYEGHRNK